MRVAVVGAGISGLVAARKMASMNAEVTIYEARDRIGGRIWTCRDALGRPLFERGAEWIDSHHERTIALVRELGLTLVAGPTGADAYRFRGRAFRSDSPDWKDIESQAEELWREVRKQAMEHDRRPWVGAGPDGTVRDWIDRHPVREEARLLWEATVRSDEGDDPDRLSARDWLAGQRVYAEADHYEMSAYRVLEGMGSLVDSIAGQLLVTWNLECPVVRVDAEQGFVALADQPAEEFDFVVLTTPPPQTCQIMGETLEWPRMGRTIRIAIGFERAWWRELGLSGRFLSDELPQQLWDGSLGGEPVLIAYLCGSASQSIDQWRSHAREMLSLAFGTPCPPPKFMDVTDWVHDPWSGGGFSLFGPDVDWNRVRYLASPIGRVHFAGEATALEHGFVEGAIESGLRVANEIRHA